MDLKNKVVLITGSSKGLGYSLLKKLNDSGCITIMNYKNLYNTLNDKYKCDITNDLELDEMIKYIIEKYGKIDILINNACYCNDMYFKNKTRQDFLYSLNVNLVSPFILIKKIDEFMTNGIIINICSTDGIDTFNPLSIDYCASKAGLINMTKNLSLVLKNKIIGIAPNYINTESVLEMNPDFLKQELKRINQKKLIDKDKLSNKIVDIISSDITSGEIVRIDLCE